MFCRETCGARIVEKSSRNPFQLSSHTGLKSFQLGMWILTFSSNVFFSLNVAKVQHQKLYLN